MEDIIEHIFTGNQINGLDYISNRLYHMYQWLDRQAKSLQE